MVKNIPPTLDALRRHKKSTTTKQDCVKKSPYFSRIRTEYREILRISPYSVQMRKKWEPE